MQVSYKIISDKPELSFDESYNVNIVRVNCEVCIQEEGEVAIKKSFQMAMESQFGFDSFDADQYVKDEDEMYCGQKLKYILSEAEGEAEYKDFQNTLQEFCAKHIAIKDKGMLLNEININYSKHMVTQNDKFAEYHTEGHGDYFSFDAFYEIGSANESMALQEYVWAIDNNKEGKHSCREIANGKELRKFIEQYKEYCNFQWEIK